MSHSLTEKAPSPAQKEELSEGKRFAMFTLCGTLAVLALGVIFALSCFKLVKYAAGVHSFGLTLFAWLGIIGGTGVVISCLMIAAAVFCLALLARLCRAT